MAVIIANASFLPLVAIPAHAKLIPSNRADIEINILMSKQEVENEEGGTEIKWSYVTEETFDSTGSDLAKLPRIFELIAIPAVNDFFEQHESDLAGKYVDTLFIRYRPHDNEVFVSIWHSFPLYESMVARALPEQYSLELVDEISFEIAILRQFPGIDQQYQSWVDFNILKYNLLPLTTVRVEYLSYKMQELYLQNRETLLKDDTTLSLPDKEPIILDSISAVMFAEMARLNVRYMDRPVGLYDGRITDYDTGAAQVVQLRSYRSAYDVPLKPDEPILFVKSSNKPLSMHASLSMYGGLLNATLIYPDGKEVALNPVHVNSEKSESESYNSYEYVHYLPADEPPGIYQLVVDSLAKSQAATTINAFAINAYLPPDYGSWFVETATLDERELHPIRYKISDNVEVGTMFVDLPANALMITINNAQPDSRLIVELPRNMVDALLDGGADKRYSVTLSDLDTANSGIETVDHEEILTNDQVRVLAIDLKDNTDLVQIAGTQVVPEFDSILAGAENDGDNKWETAHIVGKFLNSDPPKPDQIFKFQYRAINGTVESFDTSHVIEGVLIHNSITAKVNSSNSGVLEVKFPRNFPYTNSGSGIGNFVFFSEEREIENKGVTADCFFVFSVPFTGSTEIEMVMPSILIKSPYHGDDVPDSCVPQTIVAGASHGATANTPPAEQLAECSRLGIDEEDCTVVAILQKLQVQTSERRIIEEQKIQFNNAMYMIGIGAAIAGVIAFMTLRKRK